MLTLRLFRLGVLMAVVLSNMALLSEALADTNGATANSASSVVVPDLHMLVIPKGVFRMGDLSGSGIKDEKPVRTVKVNSFLLGRTEVTWNQYQPCIDSGACPDNSEDGGDNRWGKEDRPVIEVSWDDIQLYLQWLNKKTGRQYRLPSEAEWEYAARAGQETRYTWGDELGKGRANCYRCGSQWDDKQTAPVGSFASNSFGLYDMQGNVWEWVQDCYHDNYVGAPKDARVWATKDDEEEGCTERVKRGGSWFYMAIGVESSYRSYSESDNRSSTVGFRLAHDVE